MIMVDHNFWFCDGRSEALEQQALAQCNAETK